MNLDARLMKSARSWHANLHKSEGAEGLRREVPRLKGEDARDLSNLPQVASSLRHHSLRRGQLLQKVPHASING